MPTLTALAGVKRVGDKPLDGRDLTPLLMKQPVEWPERMIFSTWAMNASVRTQTHRLDNTGQLYDMIADPGQTTPINDKEPALAAKLTDAVKAWRQDVFGAAAALPKAKGDKKKGRAMPSIRVRFRSATASSPSPCCPRVMASRAAACSAAAARRTAPIS
jgi:hypothetical protein